MKFENWIWGLPGLLYDWGKSVGEKKSRNAQAASSSSSSSSTSDNSAAKNVYNYNYLNDSVTGNTLFDSQKKTKRTVFGNE